MYSDSLEKWLGAVDDTALSSTDKADIASLYRTLTGKDIRQCNCRNRYTDAALEIYQILKKKEMKIEYELKAGVVKTIRSTGEVYTNANLTTSVAEKILKACPDDIRFFSHYPADWKDRIFPPRKNNKTTQK